MPIVIFANYNYFCNISFSRPLFFEIDIMNVFNARLIFAPELFILCKNVWGLEGAGVAEFDIPTGFEQLSY